MAKKLLVSGHTEKKWLPYHLFIKIYFANPYHPEKHHFRINPWQM